MTGDMEFDDRMLKMIKRMFDTGIYHTTPEDLRKLRSFSDKVTSQFLTDFLEILETS